MVAFDHAENGFDLPTLSIDIAIESPLHQATILTAKGFGGRTAVLGRNCTANIVYLTGKAMIGFTVIASIGKDMFDGIAADRRRQGLLELVDVHRGTARRDRRKDQVIAAVAGNGQLGPASIMRVFMRLKLLGASSANEITADMPSFQAGGVDRRQGDLLALAKGLYATVQNRVGQAKTQKSLGGFLQRGEVRHARQAKRLAEVGTILQNRDNASIVRLIENLQDQANKQLRLRESLRTELVTVHRQRTLGDGVSGLCHGFGGL